MVHGEFHEFVLSHPDHKATFKQFATICSQLNIQCLAITASLPEHLFKIFCKRAHIPKMFFSSAHPLIAQCLATTSSSSFLQSPNQSVKVDQKAYSHISVYSGTGRRGYYIFHESRQHRCLCLREV
jgi:hypothetical protein